MRVVLVLSGGGAKALAAVGAFRALADRGLAPARIIGTSMGALVGAALAGGQSPDQVLAAGRTLTRKAVAPTSPAALLAGVFASSFLKADGLRRAIARMVPVTRFADLATPLTVTATDRESGELALFGADGRDAPLPDALYASCALPLYYPPGEIGGRQYLDGGLRAVLPIGVARRVPADLVVAINVGPGFDETLVPGQRSRVPGLLRAHGEAERIMMAAQAEREIAAWPADAAPLLVIRAVAEREATFALDQVDRYVRQGYERTKDAIESTLGR